MKADLLGTKLLKYETLFPQGAFADVLPFDCYPSTTEFFRTLLYGEVYLTLGGADLFFKYEVFFPFFFEFQYLIS